MSGMGRAAWIAAVGLMSMCGAAWAQSSVTYGKITRVSMVTQTNPDAQATGAVLGGIVGLASGRGQSGSNRALRAVGGGVAGQQLARMGSNRQVFEYTILLDGTTTFTMISDEGGLGVGDCVAVERGSFNNLRLVDDARCAPRPKQAQGAAPAPKVTPAAQRQSDACVTAKEQLLNSETDEAFERAYRRVRLLCAD